MSRKKHKLQRDNVRGVAVRRTQFSGPLPPPQILDQYNQIVPGAAERILAMAERQSRHRINMESKVIESDISNSKRGIICGFIITLVVIAVSAYLAIKGQSIVGGIFGSLDIVALVSIFVYGSKQRKEEREERRE